MGNNAATFGGELFIGRGEWAFWPWCFFMAYGSLISLLGVAHSLLAYYRLKPRTRYVLGTGGGSMWCIFPYRRQYFVP